MGKIWSVREARFIDQPTVLRALGDASFVLLGEKHDNPDHHRLQASALAALVARGKKPVVAWEMLELPAQARLDAYRAQAGATAENLGPALSWESSSWPPWPDYLPIAEVAFQAQLRMVAANLPQSVARSLVHEGASALGLKVPSAWGSITLSRASSRHPCSTSYERRIAAICPRR